MASPTCERLPHTTEILDGDWRLFFVFVVVEDLSTYPSKKHDENNYRRLGDSRHFIEPGKQNYTIHAGDRVAQLVIAKYEAVEWEEGELNDTARGAGGFGSSGR